LVRAQYIVGPCHDSQIWKDILETFQGASHHLDLGHNVENLSITVELSLNGLLHRPGVVHLELRVDWPPLRGRRGDRRVGESGRTAWRHMPVALTPKARIQIITS
jgi:hypothetical protein